MRKEKAVYIYIFPNRQDASQHHEICRAWKQDQCRRLSTLDWVQLSLWIFYAFIWCEKCRKMKILDLAFSNVFNSSVFLSWTLTSLLERWNWRSWKRANYFQVIKQRSLTTCDHHWPFEMQLKWKNLLVLWNTMRFVRNNFEMMFHQKKMKQKKPFDEPWTGRTAETDTKSLRQNGCCEFHDDWKGSELWKGLALSGTINGY